MVKLTPDNRIFSGSISVRIGTKRTKIDLSPAEVHGGEDGFYRVRIGRKWHDKPGGGMLFLDRAGLAELVASMALEEMPEIPLQAPHLPIRTRVSVKLRQGIDCFFEQTWTSTPPIRGFDGQFYVGVMTYSQGFVFVPVEDVTRRDTRVQ